MAKRIPIAESTIPRIRTSESTLRRIDPQVVADALGAEPCPEHIERRPGPFTLYLLRSELFRRRHSSGGRPGIEGTDFRAKIPVGEQDWQRLEALAESLSAEGFSPSPGQVASVLLSLAVRSVTDSATEQDDSTTTLVRELATRLAGDKSR